MSVETILQALAESSGRAALQRGAILGGTIQQIAALPQQIYDDREHQRQVALANLNTTEGIRLRQAQEQRDIAATAHQTRLDAEAQRSKLAEQEIMKAYTGGNPTDPSQFDLKAGLSKAQEVDPSYVPHLLTLHTSLQAPIEPVDPEKDIINKRTGEIVRKGIPKVKEPTGPELDARAQALYAKQEAAKTGGPPFTAADQLELLGYIKRKTTVSDPAQIAATERQTEAIKAAAASQKRTQDFNEAQVGRKELTDKVEQPFQAQQNAAQVLRDTVKSAQGGNKLAASMQSLEAAMAAVKGQGFNRINMAEIAMPASAGSAWDRLKGWAGGKVEGQPVPANIQKDMLEFADVMENAAHKKYLAQHKSVTTRYGLTNEVPLPAPASTSAPVTPQLTPGLAGLAGRK